MPLGKKKSKAINNELKTLTNFIYLWKVRAELSEHSRTTVTHSTLCRLLNSIQSIKDNIN